MSNKVKCEWCGHYYDLNKYENCPKCGGSNSYPYVEKEDNSKKNNQSINKNSNKKTKNKNSKLKKLIIIILCLLIIPNVLLSCVALMIDSSSDYSYNARKAHFYYTDEKLIEIGNAKFYVSSMSSEDSDYYYSSINPEIYLYFIESDYNSHSIDFYLFNGESKYRVITDDYSFNNDSVKSMNDILKSSGSLKISGECDINPDSVDFTKFDRLVLEIDGIEYEISLRYDTGVFGDGYQDDEYSFSGKVSFGSGNSLYIDKMTTSTSSYNLETDITLNIETNIIDYTCENIEFFLEDEDENLYRLYFDDRYNYYVKSFDSILKTNIANKSVSFHTYSKIFDFKSLHVIIDGEESIVNFK